MDDMEIAGFDMEVAAARQIDFADVRVGDTILERHTYQSLTHTRMGVVHKKTLHRLYTERQETIGWDAPRWPAWKNHQLFLVSRPKPVLPVTAPAEIIDVILEDFQTADRAILADDGWHCFTGSGVHFRVDAEQILSWNNVPA